MQIYPSFVWRLFFLFVLIGNLFLVPLFAFGDMTQDDLQNSIRNKEKKLEKEEKKYQSLQRNLSQIKNSLGSTLAAIGRTRTLLAETTDVIRRKELEVQLLEESVQLKKETLAALIQEMYFSGDKPLTGVLLGETGFSAAFDETTNITRFAARMQGLVDEVQDLKSQTQNEKANLEAMKAENERLLAEKAAQKQALASDVAETQADIEDQEKVIARLKKELSQLQGDLATLTGKSYNAKDIREAVEFASKKTGVPEGVLYGFLKVETNLGANTGQCTYVEVEKVSIPRYKKYGKKYQASIDLFYKRQKLFLDLVKTLGYGKDKKVSCSPSGYIGQGGAMGVAQFMSDVWAGYSSRISANTGHKNPDPWNLTDGVMAMAIKLRGAGATSDKESAIKQASINYLGRYYPNYYNGIVYWSKNYKALFQ